jgi:hypothetical protein
MKTPYNKALVRTPTILRFGCPLVKRYTHEDDDAKLIYLIAILNFY